MNERLIAARERLRNQNEIVICDTPELLAQHQADGARRLGDAVVIHRPLPIGSMQDNWDDMVTREILRNNPHLWD